MWCFRPGGVYAGCTYGCVGGAALCSRLLPHHRCAISEPPAHGTHPHPAPPQVLGTYKPLVWEYSRLNITHNVMSKRKLNRLVTDK